MAEKINSVCAICGKGYHVCGHCRSKLEPWKYHTDTSEHYKIYQILHGYSTGVYTQSEAKNKLQVVDLSDLDSFREHIKVLIKKILADNKTTDKVESKNTEKVSATKSKTIRKRKNTKITETVDNTVSI